MTRTTPGPNPYTLHLTPHTLHPTPYTLHSPPYTLHPTPYTLHPAPYNTLHPTPFTQNPTPYTLHSPPYTLHSTPNTLTPTPHNLHPALLSPDSLLITTKSPAAEPSNLHPTPHAQIPNPDPLPQPSPLIPSPSQLKHPYTLTPQLENAGNVQQREHLPPRPPAAGHLRERALSLKEHGMLNLGSISFYFTEKALWISEYQGFWVHPSF